MGIAVTALLKHNFDTSSIEVLAEQLAERLDAMIIFGYMDDWSFQREAPFDFVVKGYAGTNEQKIYFLRWEWYYDTVLGVEEDYRDGVASLKPIPENQRYWTFELNLPLPVEDEPRFIQISKDCLDPDVCYGGKWGRFVSPFINDDKNGWWEQKVLEFRKKVQYVQQLFGAAPVAWYYADSFSDAAELIELTATGTWEDVMRFIKGFEESNGILDVCRWYRNKEDYLEEEPILFRDDFSNLVVRRQVDE